jgi:hypothetical protein
MISLEEIQKEERQQIPQNFTQRWEYVKCGKTDCECFGGAKIHGPYLYIYWKDAETKKLKKKYIGKSWDEYYQKRGEQKVDEMTGGHWTHSQWQKVHYLNDMAEKGIPIAKEYWDRFNERKPGIFKNHRQRVSIDWAYKVVKERINEDRFLKVLRIAKQKEGIEWFHNNDEYINYLKKLMKDNNLENTDELDDWLHKHEV